jgi:HD-like signal output (HDOD) protein
MSSRAQPRQVLLVDDEPQVLDGLLRVLRPLRKEWLTLTAGSGEEPLRLLGDHAVDVIVTDMQMPDMDGAALLTSVKARQPKTVRVVLSGETTQQVALRAVPVAHQFLSKPCEPDILTTFLRRTGKALDAMHSERMRAAVGGLGALPGAPDVCVKLMQAVDDPEIRVSEVVAILERDVAMVAKILQIANSSFFGLRSSVSSVADAVGYLGLVQLRDLVTSLSVTDAFPHRATRFDSSGFHCHSMAVAAWSRRLAPTGCADDAFVAGLLHDVGELVVQAQMPDAYDEIASRSAASGRPFDSEMSDVLACTRAEIGGYLLNVWGLPWRVVETVANQNEPDAKLVPLDVAGAVRLAHAVWVAATTDGVIGSPEAEVLAQIGASEHVAGWLAEAARASERPSPGPP